VSLQPFESREFEDLLDIFTEGELSAAEAVRFNELLSSNADAQQMYLSYFGLHSALEWDLADRPAFSPATVQLSASTAYVPTSDSLVERVTTSPDPASSFVRRLRLTPRLIGLAASAVLAGYFIALVGLVMWDQSQRVERNEVGKDVLSESFATLTRADDSRWEQTPDLAADSRLVDRTLQVRTGFAELEFAQGAKVVVQGPAEFEVRSANRGFLRRGKLVAVVPPQAIGFTIATPKAEIVDLGTEFGVEVDDHQNAEVHVFTGVVVARPTELALAQGPGVRITAGKALRIDGRQANFTSVPIPPRQRSEFVKAPLKHQVVKLQNATGTFSQPSYTVSDTLDGSMETGWGIIGGVGSDQQAVWETATDVGGPGGTAFRFTLIHAISRQHGIGKFRLSVTTDDREKFADGLPTTGKVVAKWTELKPLGVIGSGHETFTVDDDNTILVGGANPDSAVYTITATTPLTGITGIRLEALTDPSFMAGGPGRFPGTGNFGLSEFRVEAAPLDLPESESNSRSQ
jgi:hypothetical protein